ncbi:DUF5777 family beta-barrel protein [Mucilaginibacter gotjawali]|uniref:DUF5777 domain-containing protein n=1 Tax=Mucilaginibacter gotjawali TaxID=1550579 RepID=A0A839SDI6_9SPHI|nr:DUF5777 family beta-barrel protein [Mucilaginibacter gotjawali]MBB3054627.1 hypothetical protein [Mucilaginibacter gotjawali]
MKKHLMLAAFLIVSSGLMAQNADNSKTSTPADSLLNSMSSDQKNLPVIGFRSTRLILSQTTETVKKKTLNFMVIHRFGDFAGKNGGGRFFYGLDDVADVYIGFEYGITDNLNIHFGRSTQPTLGGLVDLELKYAMLHQTTDNSVPVSLTVLGQAGVRPYNTYNSFGDRLSYFGQLIIAKQFGSNFTLQVSPGFVQDNTAYPLVAGNQEGFFSLAAAARLKVTRHLNLIIDYAHPFSSFRTGANGFTDPLGFGFEIETGGHVFTLNITNARSVSEINYLSNNQADFGKGQYRIGFTISRIFDFNHKSSYK